MDHRKPTPFSLSYREHRLIFGTGGPDAGSNPETEGGDRQEITEFAEELNTADDVSVESQRRVAELDEEEGRSSGLLRNMLRTGLRTLGVSEERISSLVGTGDEEALESGDDDEEEQEEDQESTEEEEEQEDPGTGDPLRQEIIDAAEEAEAAEAAPADTRPGTDDEPGRAGEGDAEGPGEAVSGPGPDEEEEAQNEEDADDGTGTVDPLRQEIIDAAEEAEAAEAAPADTRPGTDDEPGRAGEGDAEESGDEEGDLPDDDLNAIAGPPEGDEESGEDPIEDEDSNTPPEDGETGETPENPEDLTDEELQQMEEEARQEAMEMLREEAASLRDQFNEKQSAMLSAEPASRDRAQLVGAVTVEAGDMENRPAEAMQAYSRGLVKLGNIQSYLQEWSAQWSELYAHWVGVDARANGAARERDSYGWADRWFNPGRAGYLAARDNAQRFRQEANAISDFTLQTAELQDMKTSDVSYKRRQLHQLADAAHAETQASLSDGMARLRQSGEELDAFQESLPNNRDIVVGCCGILPGGGVAASLVWDSVELANGNITTEELLTNLAVEGVSAMAGRAGGAAGRYVAGAATGFTADQVTSRMAGRLAERVT